jgi:hypothetical protein
VPRPTSTAPSRGIAVPPFVCATDATGPAISPFVLVGGNGATTASTTPGTAGVVGPHAGV